VRQRGALALYLPLGALAIGLLGGFGLAWQLQAGRHAQAELQRRDTDVESQRLQRRGADSQAARHEAEKARIAAQRRTVTREVERVITIETAAAAAVCLGPLGLQQLAEAVNGTGDPGQPAPALPAASAPAR
jgi:hypothetical protein